MREGKKTKFATWAFGRAQLGGATDGDEEDLEKRGLEGVE